MKFLCQFDPRIECIGPSQTGLPLDCASFCSIAKKRGKTGITKRVKRLLKHVPYAERIYQRLRGIPCSWHDVSKMTSDWAKQLVDEDLDCIIGLPRAGLLIGNILAEELGLPLSTPTSFMRGELWYSQHLHGENRRSIKRTLIVDDSVERGRNLNGEYARLSSKFPEIKFLRGSLLRFGRDCPLDYVYAQDIRFASPPGKYKRIIAMSNEER